MKKLMTLFFILSLTLIGQAQVSKTVDISAAGSLSSALSANEKDSITNLTITGTIDARDFVTMRDSMTMLTVLDLSAVTIVSYTGSLTYPANEIPQCAFFNQNNDISKTSLKTITLPASITSIGSQAFYSCSGLTSITIPNSVTSIGTEAFSRCSGLNGSLILPNSITSIGDYAFGWCTGLTGNLTIPNLITHIGYGIFENCTGLKSITIPNSITSINDYDFAYCIGLTSLTIPNSITSINYCAFQGCTGLTGILTIPNSVTSIGTEAFQGCSGLTDFNVQTNNANYSAINGVLFNKNGTELIEYPCGKSGIYTIPNSVTSIDDEAFNGCTELTGSLTIPNSVTSIGDYAFAWCTGLTSLILPNSVTSIGYESFGNCTGITSIYANSSTPLVLDSTDSVFNYINKTTCTLYVPIGSKSAYQAADQWKDFLNIVEISTATPTVVDVSLSLYPNPATDFIKITGIEGTVLIIVEDINGRTLLTKQIIANENISIGSLPNGIYIVKLTTTEGTTERKMVKK